MSSSDTGMFKVMGMVLGSVVLFTLLCMTVARMLGIGGGGGEDDALMRNALIQRIEPVGKVRTSADDLPATQVADAGAAAGGAKKTGEELVEGACSACHAGGVGGAPMLDDEEAWATRREAGLEALIASVTNGKGAMPARGGSQYSDEEIEVAVKHIALFPKEESEESAEAPAEEAPAEEEGATAETPAEGDGAAEGEEAAEAPADAGAESGGDVDLVAMIASGTEPDGMNDNIKTNVDGVCAGCHIAGVANAPKLGDKEAWSARAELGLDALSQSVINGKNAMPAMGGSGLSPEEIPVAIQYLISKQ